MKWSTNLAVRHHLNLTMTTAILCAEIQAYINATEGQTSYLDCNTTSRPVIPPVDWKYQRAVEYRDEYICLAGRVVAEDVSRFELHHNTTLVIHNVTVNDSRIYYCIEDMTDGEMNIMYLNVSEISETGRLTTLL